MLFILGVFLMAVGFSCCGAKKNKFKTIGLVIGAFGLCCAFCSMVIPNYIGELVKAEEVQIYETINTQYENKTVVLFTAENPAWTHEIHADHLVMGESNSKFTVVETWVQRYPNKLCDILFLLTAPETECRVLLPMP